MLLKNYCAPLLLITLALLSALGGCRHEPMLSGEDDFVPTDTVVIQPGDTTTNDPGSGSPGGDPGSGGVPCEDDVIYFSQQILPLLRSNCALSGCHDAASAQDGVILTSFTQVVNTADVKAYDLEGSDLYEVLVDDDEDDRMPPAPRDRLSNEQINLIAEWILQGAQDISCDANAGGCDTNEVSFQTQVQPVIQSHCQGCHSGNTPSGGVNLASYQGIRQVAENGRLVGAISWQDGYARMPQGGEQLPDCTIDQIKSWVDSGAMDN